MTELIQSNAAGGVSLADKITYAEHLAQSGLLPKAYQRQPANVLLAMEYGDALGIHQMTAINEINVIQGKPAMSASLMQSLARAAGHKVRVSGDAEHATCKIIRRDDPDFEHVSEWDRAKAESSGLWGKGHWAKDPALMLKWRAISECVRLACSEVLGGLKYTPEEVTEFTAPEWRTQPQGGPQHVPAGEPQRQEAPPPAEEQHPVEESAEQQVDDVEARIQQSLESAWDDPERLMKLGKWMRSAKAQDPRLERIYQRYQELTQPAPDPASAPERESVDGEIVDEGPLQEEELPIGA